MKISNLLEYSLKNIIRNKKYLFVFIADIICLGIFFATLLISITYKIKIYSNSNNNPLMNTISINFSNEKIHGNDYSEEEMLKVLNRIERIDHVKGYFHQKYTHSGGMISNDTGEMIYIEPLIDDIELPGISYKEKLKKNEIIIPEKFYQLYYSNYDEVDEDKIIDGKSLIGKTIKISYDVLDCKTEEYIDTKYLELNVVGTYNSSLTGLNMFYSFASVDTIRQIADNFLINITDSYKVDDTYYIQVDESKNVEYVKNKVKHLGLTVDDGVVYVLSEYYNTYVYLMNTISIISFVFLILFKVLFIRKIMNDNKKIIFINSINGYKKNALVLEELIKNILLDILSTIIVSIIILLGISYFKSEYQNLVVAGYIPIYPLTIIIYYLIVIFIIEYLSITLRINKMLENGLSSLRVD